jgi:putative heme-binding domain-containing protein
VLAAKLADVARREPNVEVRAQLACTAKRLPAHAAWPLVRALLAHHEDTADPRLPLLLWWAIEAKAGADREGVVTLFQDRAAWDLPLVKEHLLERVMRRFAQAGAHDDLLTCAALLRLAPTQEHAAKLLIGFEAAFKGRSVAGLPEELLEALAPFGGLSLALDVRRGDPAAIEHALAIVTDESADRDQRLHLLEVLGEVRAPQCVPVLLRLLQSPMAAATRPGAETALRTPHAALQQAALVALQPYEDEKIGREVLAAWPSLGVEARTAAFTLLASRPAWAQALLEAVDSGQIAKSLVPQDTLAKLARYRQPRVAELFAKHFSQTRPPTRDEMQARIARVREVLHAGVGNPYAGQPLFATLCGACHTLFGQGGRIGPDLTAFQRDDLDTLLLSVVNPNAEIREGYENYYVTTKDERTLSGFLVERDDHRLVLRGLDGTNLTLQQEDIAEFKPAGLSLMPEGLLDALDDQQIRDLFAYLRSTQPLVR